MLPNIGASVARGIDRLSIQTVFPTGKQLFSWSFNKDIFPSTVAQPNIVDELWLQVRYNISSNAETGF